MTDKPPAGHETPEQRTALEEAFTRMVRGNATGPTADRIAATIRARQDARTTPTTDTTEKD